MPRGSKSKNKKPAKPAAPRSWRWRAPRPLWHGVALVVVVAGAAFELRQLKDYVEHHLSLPTDPLIVVVKNRPRWMNDQIVEQLAARVRPAGARSAFDRQVLVDARTALEADPWIERVNQVRRAYTNQPGDTLEIDCQFRVPAAVVRWGDYYWLVDRKSVKLPEQFSVARMPREVISGDGRINLRIIEGVRKPPPEAGQVWAGDDLSAGLEMATVLFNRPYTEDIVKIDVSNLGGRVRTDAAQITLTTRYGTSILWGRPPSDPDSFIELRPDQKLDTLNELFGKFGRVDMRQPWIDIRFDGVRYAAPPPEPPTARLDFRH